MNGGLDSLLGFGALCFGEQMPALFDLKNVPELILYSHLPAAIIATLLSLFLLLKGWRKITNVLLSFALLFFSYWVYANVLIWGTNRSDIIMFHWSLQILFEPLVYIGLFYLLSIFVLKIDVPFRAKMIFGILYLPLVISIPTRFTLSGFDLVNCIPFEGFFGYYAYFLEAISLLGISYYTFWKSRFINDINNKKSIFYLGVGSILFLFTFGSGNVFGSLTGEWVKSQFGLFGMPVFAAFLAYSIVKFKAFDVKLIGAQALVIALVLLIGSQFFFIKTTINFILTGVTLVLSIGFGWALIRSIKQEVKRKEELQRISDNLAVTNERLKELDNAKSEFISIASHQLRTPLTAIKGYVSLLLEGSYGKTPAPIQDVLDKVYTINNRLVQLVENLLNVSRIEAGRIQYNFELIWLEPLVMEIVDTFAITAKNKNLTLTFNRSKQMLSQLTLDPNKIKEVVSNLIDNAIKYTKKGGVTVSVEAREGAAWIIISDTGIGIHPSDKVKLFEKFTRSKETASMVVSGSGLGLYVGKSFVQAHGGKIWAESEGMGRGSRFIVELPFLNPNVKVGVSEQFSTLGRGK